MTIRPDMIRNIASLWRSGLRDQGDIAESIGTSGASVSRIVSVVNAADLNDISKIGAGVSRGLAEKVFMAIGRGDMTKKLDEAIEYGVQQTMSVAEPEPNATPSLWTDINDNPPPVGEPLMVTVEDDLSGNRKVYGGVYYMIHPMNDRWCFLRIGCREDFGKEVGGVVAWMRMPEPYRQ